MKRFYLTDDTYAKFSEEGFEKLENIKLITKENETIKAKMFYVNHVHFDKKYLKSFYIPKNASFFLIIAYRYYNNFHFY